MAACANSCAEAAEVRRTAEAVSNLVLNSLAQSQDLCSENFRIGQSSERMVQVDLKDRISEVEFWRGTLRSLSRSLQEQMRLLAHEKETLRVVVMRIQAELKHRAMGRVCTLGPREPPAREAVEIELQEELNLLRTEKSKFTKMIFQVNHKLEDLTKTKRAIDEDLQLKSHGIRVDREITSPAPVCWMINYGKKKKLKSNEAWQVHCRKLQEEGKNAANTAALLREECRAMRTHLTCAAHSQAERVEAALRRRIHYSQNQLHDLRWQLAELDQDLERLKLEQCDTEKAVDSCLAQQNRARVTLHRRSNKPDSEHCDDAATQRLQRELARLKKGISDLRINLDNIRSLRNTLEAARGEMECCVQDIQLQLQLDVDRSRCRASAYVDDDGGKPAGGCNSSAKTRRDIALNVIYESDECGGSEGGE